MPTTRAQSQRSSSVVSDTMSQADHQDEISIQAIQAAEALQVPSDDHDDAEASTSNSQDVVASSGRQSRTPSRSSRRPSSRTNESPAPQAEQAAEGQATPIQTPSRRKATSAAAAAAGSSQASRTSTPRANNVAEDTPSGSVTRLTRRQAAAIAAGSTPSSSRDGNLPALDSPLSMSTPSKMSSRSKLSSAGDGTEDDEQGSRRGRRTTRTAKRGSGLAGSDSERSVSRSRSAIVVEDDSESENVQITPGSPISHRLRDRSTTPTPTTSHVPSISASPRQSPSERKRSSGRKTPTTPPTLSAPLNLGIQVPKLSPRTEASFEAGPELPSRKKATRSTSKQVDVAQENDVEADTEGIRSSTLEGESSHENETHSKEDAIVEYEDEDEDEDDADHSRSTIREESTPTKHASGRPSANADAMEEDFEQSSESEDGDDSNSASDSSDPESDEEDAHAESSSVGKSVSGKTPISSNAAAFLARALERARNKAKAVTDGQIEPVDELQMDVLRVGGDEGKKHERPIPGLTAHLPAYHRLNLTGPLKKAKSKDALAASTQNKTSVKAVEHEKDAAEYVQQQSRKQQSKIPRPQSVSEAWATLPSAPDALLPQMKRDYQALALANSLDPKRFMKGGKGSNKVPEKFAIGTLITPSRQLAPTTLARERNYQPGSIVSNLIQDSDINSYAKRKFDEFADKRMANGKGKGWKKRKGTTW